MPLDLKYVLVEYSICFHSANSESLCKTSPTPVLGLYVSTKTTQRFFRHSIGYSSSELASFHVARMKYNVEGNMTADMIRNCQFILLQVVVKT
ncbi:hypothetical protein BYT27DRAFT_7180911 [Phlegmacium glaucopus]|nr:hypothetical protein BYT27DRAFT_7180911 [Phlegmacium glaucopus]